MAVLKLRATASDSGGFNLVWIDKPTLYSGSVYVNELELDIGALPQRDKIVLAIIEGSEPISLLSVDGNVDVKRAYLPRTLTLMPGQRNIGLVVKVPEVYQGATRYRVLTTQAISISVEWSASDIGKEDTMPQNELDNLREQIENIALITGPKGDKGDVGYTGDKGDKGDKGNQGNMGMSGANAFVAWGVNSACPMSTMKWRIL